MIPRYRTLLLSLSACVAALALQAATPARRAFDLPADTADKSIKRFSEQAGLEVFYASTVTKGLRTPAIKGEMTASEALDALLAGTGLVIVRDEKSGAFSIRREENPSQSDAAERPNVPRAARPPASDRPSPSQSKALTAGEEQEGVVKLSPFEVNSDHRGYYAPNTTSGTRLNSNIEDLAASISVVTKEQMQDFGLLDLNDIFNYEAGTEGTGNFTDMSFDLSGNPIDNTQLNPQGANRIRGLGSANITVGNFETSGRTPLDPIAIDAVEISRGPNSSIFGIGSPAGTVNSVPASANLTRNSAQLVTRVDSRDGYRTSLDVNRTLKRGVLALRGSVVFQHDGFELKPSGIDTRRYTGMVKYRPFKRTTLSASYAHYHMQGNRPNTTPPRDGISGWLAAGSPTWDPVTTTAKVNGRPVGTTFGGTTPAYFTTFGAFSQAFIDQNGLGFLVPTATTAANNPSTQNQNFRLLAAAPDPSGFLASQPLLQDYPVLSNKSIYDWSRVNIAAQNRIEDTSKTASVLLDQVFLDSPRQNLAMQFGWYREFTDRFARNLMGTSSATQGFAPNVSIDVNERLPDGRANPYFGRPFVGLNLPGTLIQPLDRDSYRGQLAYRLDLRGEKNGLRWLGMHQVSAYAEYKDIKSRQIRLRDGIVDAHPWIPANTLRGGDPASAYRVFFRYYVGDNQGSNVDYAPTAFTPGKTVLTWGNGATGQFVQEPVVLDAAPSTTTGGTSNSWTILKSQGAVLQSHLLKNRIITTIGVRADARYSRRGATALVPDGLNIDYESFNQWASGDWSVGKGHTTTAGVVAKPLRWISIYGNRSNSFNPASLAYSLYREVLPDPTGRGEDYGVALNLFEGRFVLRVNRYKTLQINSRSGESAAIAQRAYRMDYTAATGMGFVLQRQATDWISAAAAAKGETLNSAQLLERVADVMQLPVDFLRDPPPAASAIDDLVARGTEIEANFNPTTHWTMKLNVTKQESINAGLAEEVGRYVDERVAVWKSIIDPRVNRPWYNESYPNGVPSAYFQSNILTPLQVARAMQGKSRPQIRKYRANFATNYRLSGLTDNRWLKRFNIGGAMRWEDKGAIGYRGVETLPAVISTLDTNRPIYDGSHLYVDALVGYRTRIFADKVGLTLQLNARNLTEGGRLQPIAAEADGRVAAYRIIDPRLFIFTATFSF